MIRQALAVMMVAAVLSGCATTTQDLPLGFELDASRAEGLAVVSLTLTGVALDQVSGYEYGIREVRSGRAAVSRTQHFESTKQFARWAASNQKAREIKWAAVARGSGAEPADILEAGKAVGRLVTLRLPAGEYEFYTWKVFEENKYGKMEYGPERTFSHRFTVQPGKAVYFGRLHLQFNRESAHILSVEGRDGEDMALFRNKYPQIAF
jgi:hypothetical protein